jgi:hypothetical protein
LDAEANIWAQRYENEAWKRLYNEQLLSLYRVIKSMILMWVSHIARMKECRTPVKIRTNKPTGKRPLGRPRCRWEENVRMRFKEISMNKKKYKIS